MRATIQLDALLRRLIYEVTLHRGSPPLVAELAQAADATAPIVRDALARLAAARIVVLQPVSGEILMAPPFSSVPTSFLVRTARHTAFANCAWDALGISAMMRVAAHIDSACGCCGERLTVETRMDGPPAGTSIIHFSVPARQWWDDIVFT